MQLCLYLKATYFSLDIDHNKGRYQDRNMWLLNTNTVVLDWLFSIALNSTLECSSIVLIHTAHFLII
jgi:hypothetical protein